MPRPALFYQLGASWWNRPALFFQIAETRKRRIRYISRGDAARSFIPSSPRETILPSAPTELADGRAVKNGFYKNESMNKLTKSGYEYVKEGLRHINITEQIEIDMKKAI